MEPRKSPNVTVRGFSVMDKRLSGLSDFSRSLNLSVLVDDTSLREAYLAAQTDGQLPTNRARVLILGEPRAGKTSLLNRLMGREFDIREQPTEGIETRMCHVTNVDQQWNESQGAKADDIKECASAVAVLGGVPADKQTGKDVNDNKSFTKQFSNQSTTEAYATSSMELMKIAAQIILLVAVIFTLGAFQYGYVVFVWCSIGATALFVDYNDAYRYATSMSVVCALLEATVRTDKSFELLACEDNEVDDSDLELLSLIVKSILFNALNTAMIGVGIGLGFRTGIAVAFSASVHPAETNLTLTNAHQGFKASLDMLVLNLVFGVGGVLSLGSYKYCTFGGRVRKNRFALCAGFIVLVLGIFLEGACHYRPYWFIFLNGFAMTLIGTWGAIFGRRATVKYGFKASYVIKKIIGFILGLYLVHVCGWSLRIPEASLLSLTFFVVSVTAHPLFDLHTSYKIWRVKEAFPVKSIRAKMEAAEKGQPLLETKLSLWDFAGDTLYHCTHHVFMPDKAIYVVVFNLHAAVSDEDGQLQKLLFWLHSVCAHACHPDAVVIIVGTHKASVSEADRLRFTEELHRRITSPFCHRLVLNPLDDKPLFLIENSQPVDEGFQQLRAEIFRRVESAEYAQERYPIKYLHFYHEIQSRRLLAETDCAANVMTLDQIRHLARDACELANEDELKNMLQFFVEAGEIIHKDDDDILRQHVVLDPQFLVDVMRKLVRIPRGSERSHRFAVDWRDYEDSGIINEGLLQHVYGDMSHLVPLLTKLLQAYDLMCPVESVVNQKCLKKSFLVPAMLPPYQGEQFWKPQTNEEVFYFDFAFFDPSTVYYRLLARCLTQCSLEKVDCNSKPLIFADRCRFHIGTSFIFKLQLERRSAQQMLLSVTALAFEQENPVWKLLRFLLNTVKSITARDYPQLGFTFGPRCPYCTKGVNSGSSSADLSEDTCEKNNQAETRIHVLKMAGDDRPFPTVSPAVMLCGQKRYEWVLSGWKSSGPNCVHRQSPQRVAFTAKTPITKLPPDLFQTVCLLLNCSLSTRNWKALAGELGKDVEAVALLDNQQITNPAERLLREWAMIAGHVTVSDLLEVLGRPSLQRMDIIQEIRGQMTHN